MARDNNSSGEERIAHELLSKLGIHSWPRWRADAWRRCCAAFCPAPADDFCDLGCRPWIVADRDGDDRCPVEALPVSPSILYLAAGAALGPAGVALLHLDPINDSTVLEHVTEAAL